LGENIADNGGLRQAFRAYESYIEEHGEEPPLPGFGYTPQQLFFLAYAQVDLYLSSSGCGYITSIYNQTWCGTNTVEEIQAQLLFGVHTPSLFRVKGVLQNSLDFAKAWNCSMPVEEEVCRIW
jgi:predicted metalloendopeptidase